MSLGDLFGDDDSEAQSYLQQALQQLQNVGVPTIASETVSNLPQETVQGSVNPNQIAVAEQAPSAYNDISLDPATRQAQMNALAGYSSIADSGGLDATSKLGIQQAVDAANEQSQGAQGAIMNTAQAEGQGGGDFALTQRALAAQGASNNIANQGLQEAAEAEANREAALNQMATIGGNVNASDFNQAATKANAQNTINAANQSAQNTANIGNVANNLTAQTTNLQNAQNVNAANTTSGQNNAYYNASLPQQQFNNEMAKATGQTGLAAAQAGAAQQAQQNSANTTGQLLKGTAQLGAAAIAASDGAAVMPSECYADGGTPHNHYLCMLMGGPVKARTPEEKAIAPGNSPRNDKIPAILSEDELVIPRDVPKTGKAMEAFAKSAPVNGDPKKKIDMTSFTKGYKRGK